jgi:signal transduction histidine kinase
MKKTVRVLVLLLGSCPATTGYGARDAPYTSLAQISSIPQVADSTVSVRATLTLNGNPSYIQDATGGASVDGPFARNLRIGDELLIEGHAEDTVRGLEFRKSRVELLWHGSPMPPLSVTADEAALGKFPALLIEVNGRLIDTESKDGDTWLRLESGRQIFMARFNSQGSSSLLPQIDKESVVRLRGICSLQPRDTQYQGGFAILLRSAEDVTVVTGPPWWSPRHLAEIGILLGSSIIAIHLLLVQTLKARFRAIMAERARLGHELHDTLAQSFAGLSYQIQAARKRVPPAARPLAQHLEIALDMVRHSHSEAHRSIMMLRPQPLAGGTDLQSAIQASLEQSTAGCNLAVQFITKGSAPNLPLLTTDTLYRIAQEAIANALRHGRPSKLDISLEYRQRSVYLSVVDDGVGFDIKSPNSQGFGVAGMRERVRALRGSFSLTSEPGKGTSVKTELHLHSNASVRALSVMRVGLSSLQKAIKAILRVKETNSL